MAVLHGVKLNFPEAREWMWDYCVYLGGYVREDGAKADLGIYVGHDDELSMACVYGHEDGDYVSGPIIPSRGGWYAETYRRAVALGLITDANV